MVRIGSVALGEPFTPKSHSEEEGRRGCLAQGERVFGGLLLSFEVP
jgi:hypothetical protein